MRSAAKLASVGRNKIENVQTTGENMRATRKALGAAIFLVANVLPATAAPVTGIRGAQEMTSVVEVHG